MANYLRQSQSPSSKLRHAEGTSYLLLLAANLFGRINGNARRRCQDASASHVTYAKCLSLLPTMLQGRSLERACGQWRCCAWRWDKGYSRCTDEKKINITKVYFVNSWSIHSPALSEQLWECDCVPNSAPIINTNTPSRTRQMNG